MGSDCAQTADVHAADLTAPGSARSAKTEAVELAEDKIDGKMSK